MHSTQDRRSTPIPAKDREDRENGLSGRYGGLISIAGTDNSITETDA
jgi:hypothetical protein